MDAGNIQHLMNFPGLRPGFLISDSLPCSIWFAPNSVQGRSILFRLGETVFLSLLLRVYLDRGYQKAPCERALFGLFRLLLQKESNYYFSEKWEKLL